MRFRIGGCLCAGLVVAAASAQQPPAPIYRVTVEQRAIPAVNYGHRTASTRIDFRGTVLLPKAHGEARIESHGGSVEIDARLAGLDAPTRFGAQYLTYVLWAITPEGRPVNLGEVLTNSSDKGRMKVTTALQTFGLIVTAEPYFAVEHPSNVVALENAMRPDTAGRVETVEAKYELLRRGSGDYPAVEIRTDNSGGREVSQAEYEAVVAVYQAQNALQIARSAGAGRYAADTLERAEQLYRDAQQLQASKGESNRVVTLAREAAQRAEDARAIAVRHAP